MPPELQAELAALMSAAGMPLPTNWAKAHAALKGVWASKWNERAFISLRNAGIAHGGLRMAVLVQQIVPADYAFVIHTTNPATRDAGEIYAEVVRGLGEVLVGNYPGRALSFSAKKADLQVRKCSPPPS